MPYLMLCMVFGNCVCDPNPCQYWGTCTDLLNGDYSCSCLPGSTGKSCEINYDDCSSNPCQNGGVCTDKLNDYRCECPIDYVGFACQYPRIRYNLTGLDDVTNDEGNIIIPIQEGWLTLQEERSELPEALRALRNPDYQQVSFEILRDRFPSHGNDGILYARWFNFRDDSRIGPKRCKDL